MKLSAVLCLGFLLLKLTYSNAEYIKNGPAVKDTLYLIQILKTSSSGALQQAKGKLQQIVPDKRILINFKSPYHYLFIGYFSSLQEAEEFQKIVEEHFPDSIITPRVVEKE